MGEWLWSRRDSSQARSAWNHEENGPVPSGTIELSLDQTQVVKTQ